MKILLKLLVCISVIGGLLPISSNAKTSTNDVQCFKHNIQLQLADGNGFLVDGTQFWVTVDVIKQGNLVTIQFPVINFQTGPISDLNIFVPFATPGGYLYTSDGFLPPDLRPADLVYRSIVAASNNGQSLPFSFAQDPATLPVPPVGYILSVTSAGAVAVQCAGTFGNTIPTGPQILMPCSITYIVKPSVSLCTNTIIDPGFTTTTQFTNPDAAFDAIRDSHVNDAFDSIAAWAWTSNGNIADKTNGTLNVFVAVGSINSNGTLSIDDPIQLSDLGPNILAWDTAVAINRTNKNNIVVSYAVITEATNPRTSQTYRAVSFDGGKTWPINGPTNIQPTGNPSDLGDNRGVAADTFGNIWYLTANAFDDLGNLINQPVFWVSTDGGDTYSVVYPLPLPDPTEFPLGTFIYDFPQYCFGQDGSGNYGIWFICDLVNFETGDETQQIGFIPIDGLGSFGVPTTELLTSITNTSILSNITASDDGRVWWQGSPAAAAGFSTFITPEVVTFKSPGPLAENIVGPWDIIIANGGNGVGLPIYISQPIDGYFTVPQSILYDDGRQALYAIVASLSPDYSQNMRITFIISRDNGQTWSDPIDLSSTIFANRGFESMALDPVTGDLVFGWYDGRNDPSYESVQYMGAIIPAAQLDALVNRIPLSNPQYQIPAATGAIG